GLLKGVDDGRVDPGFLHRLDRLEFDLLDWRQVEEDGIVWARLPTILVDELLPLLLQQVGHRVVHRDRLEDRAGLILLPLEPLVVAAVLVLPAAAARAGCVPRELLAWHALRSSGERLLRGPANRPVILLAGRAGGTFSAEPQTPCRILAEPPARETSPGRPAGESPGTTRTPTGAGRGGGRPARREGRVAQQPAPGP